MVIVERLKELCVPLAEAEGLELVDIEYKREGDTWVLRVFVDKPGGISLDACSSVSRSLSALLDVEEVISQKYNLEVSSPGINRPLKKAADFQRFQGERIKAKLFAPLENGQKTFVGTIKENNEKQVVIECAGENEGELEEYILSFTAIAKANLEPYLFPTKKS